MSIKAYPLDWPPGWRRTTERTSAKFVGRKGKWTGPENERRYQNQQPVTILQAIERVREELRRFGVEDEHVVISSNLPLRVDGLPRADSPADTGVAVYWTKGKEGQRCMAIDRYDRVADNLAAVAATLDAMRAIERHGGATILDRAFAGFKSLPAPEQPWQVLGIPMTAPVEQIEIAYRRLASKVHPDHEGGSEREMARINAARDAMMAQRIG